MSEQRTVGLVASLLIHAVMLGAAMLGGAATWASSKASYAVRPMTATTVTLVTFEEAMPEAVPETPPEERESILLQPERESASPAPVPEAQDRPKLVSGKPKPQKKASSSVSKQVPSSVRPVRTTFGTAAEESAALVPARPEYLTNPPPRYPMSARRSKREGLVVLLVEVSAAGRAEEVSLLASSGFEDLDGAALETVKGWRFKPATRLGAPASSRIEVPVRFVLAAAGTEH